MSLEPTGSELKLARRPCPICSTKQVEILHTQRFQMPEDSPLPDLYDVVACPGCGLVYADTPASQRDYDRYYAEFSKYEDPVVATGGGDSELDAARLGDTADAIAARTDRNARVLDIGCAGGGLLSALRHRGYERLHGADAAPACVAQVASMGIESTRASLSELESLESGGPYDVIVLSHVLEHVVALQPLVSTVAKLLPREGLVYVETPDAARYCEFDFVPFYFFDAEHINHFDAGRLAALGRSAGLVAEASGQKDLRVAPEKSYPACWTWWQMGGGSAGGRKEGGRRVLRNHVADYVRRCRLAGQFPHLRDLARSRKPVIVWGAGSLALRLFGENALAGCHIVAVADRDRNKQGRSLAGFTIDAPEAALARHPDAVVLVAAAVCDEAIAAEARAIRAGVEIVTVQSVPPANRVPNPARTSS